MKNRNRKPQPYQPWPGCITILPDWMLEKKNTKNLLYILRKARKQLALYYQRSDLYEEYDDAPLNNYVLRLKELLGVREHVPR